MKSTYLANKVLDHFWGGGGVTPDATVYLALFVGGAPGTGTEVATGGYARKSVTNNGTILGTTPAGGSLVNVAPVVFTVATGPWGTISHLAVYDAPTGGNLLEHGALTTPVAVATGESLAFAVGAINFTEA